MTEPHLNEKESLREVFIDPGYDAEELLTAIRRNYGLDARRLTFVPKGFVAASYIVDCVGEPSACFLKVFNDSRWGRMGAERLNFILPLSERLRSLGLHVPGWYRTLTGAQTTQVGNLTLMLYEYLPGMPLDEAEQIPDWLPERLAKELAQLHRITPQIGMPIPEIEQFSPYFVDELFACLEELDQLSSSARPGQLALRDLLLPDKQRLKGMVDRVYALGRTAGAYAHEFVLCHTDLHYANLIQADTGELYLLDWEGAMLAPPEHDLFMFTGEAFPAFLQAYADGFQHPRLHADTFGYYFYLRNLEDLTDWLMTILHENTSDAQDEADLEGIRQDVIANWPFLEANIQELQKLLE